MFLSFRKGFLFIQKKFFWEIYVGEFYFCSSKYFCEKKVLKKKLKKKHFFFLVDFIVSLMKQVFFGNILFVKKKMVQKRCFWIKVFVENSFVSPLSLLSHR